MVGGGCQPFWSSIPIEGILGNRVVALYTLVAPCRVLSENLAWYLKRSVLTTPFQGIRIYGSGSFEKIKIHTPQRRKQDMEGTTP
jgi:hypothetical protein